VLGGTRLQPRLEGSLLAHAPACFPAGQNIFATSTIFGPLRYFLTFVTHRRQHHFTKDGAVTLVWLQLLRAARQEGVEILAFCFMPDHVHLVVVATYDAYDFLAFIRRAKQLSGYYYSRRFNQRLCQPDSYEHVLRDNEATEAVIRYVIENPLKAGLVERLEDYPTFGSMIYPRDASIEFLQFPGQWEP
jgi:putative transposase